MGFWSINPYVGCEFGCTYCYARDTHRWVMERADRRTGGRADGSKSFECGRLSSLDSPDAPSAVRPSACPPGRPSRKRSWSNPTSPRCWAVRSNPLGWPATRWSLAPPPIRISRPSGGFDSPGAFWRCCAPITGSRSRSSPSRRLVTRDLDLLQALSQQNEVNVNISLATADPRLARRLELRSPVPAARLRALRRLTEGGVYAGLIVAPIIPGHHR